MKTVIRWLILFLILMVGAFLGAGLSRALSVKGLESSEVAGWVQAIGATIGIGIAIWVPHQQRLEAVREGRIRTFHHAMAIVNDLRSRVTYLKKIYAEGGRPLAALTITGATFIRRYETLFDRDLYAHLPGPIVDKILELSGSFNGIETSIAVTAFQLENKLSTVLGPLPPRPAGEDPFEELYQHLDELWTALEAEANATRE